MAASSALGCLPLCCHGLLGKKCQCQHCESLFLGLPAVPPPAHPSLLSLHQQGLATCSPLLASTRPPGAEPAAWDQLEIVIEAERDQLYNVSNSGFNYTEIASYTQDFCKNPQQKAPGSHVSCQGRPTVDHSPHARKQPRGLHTWTLSHPSEGQWLLALAALSDQ